MDIFIVKKYVPSLQEFSSSFVTLGIYDEDHISDALEIVEKSFDLWQGLLIVYQEKLNEPHVGSIIVARYDIDGTLLESSQAWKSFLLVV